MTPPRAPLWIGERTLCADEREPVIGDLVEEYTARAAADGRRARLWLWGQALRSAWPNLRRRWGRGSPGRPRHEVVGVVADAHYRTVREAPRPTFSVHLAEWPARTGAVHVRFAGDPAARLDELRRVVGGAAPRRRRALFDDGLPGRPADAEIGVRVALGARTRDLRRMVLRDAALIVVPGLACGVALAAWIGPTLRGLLYGVEPHDPVSVLAASWIPARRAALVDPLEALCE